MADAQWSHIDIGKFLGKPDKRIWKARQNVGILYPIVSGTELSGSWHRAGGGKNGKETGWQAEQVRRLAICRKGAWAMQAGWRTARLETAYTGE